MVENLLCNVISEELDKHPELEIEEVYDLDTEISNLQLSEIIVRPTEELSVNDPFLDYVKQKLLPKIGNPAIELLEHKTGENLNLTYLTLWSIVLGKYQKTYGSIATRSEIGPLVEGTVVGEAPILDNYLRGLLQYVGTSL